MADDLKLGHIIEDGREANRDAIHVAVVPVTAQVVLIPGQKVNPEGLPLGTLVGIVDPFLPDVVRPGQRFWLWLTPGTVTDMRHHWRHPAFAEQDKPSRPISDVAGTKSPAEHASYSESWLREYAAGTGIEFDDLLAAGEQYARTGYCTVQHNSQDWRDEFNRNFWHHYEIFTGTKVSDEVRESNPFCCTC